MGNGGSKDESQNTNNDNRQQENVVTENSSGFHVLEIHTPTAGLGIIVLGAIICVFLCSARCYRKYRDRLSGSHRRRAWYHHGRFGYAANPRDYEPHGLAYPYCPDLLAPRDVEIMAGLAGRNAIYAPDRFTELVEQDIARQVPRLPSRRVLAPPPPVNDVADADALAAEEARHQRAADAAVNH